MKEYHQLTFLRTPMSENCEETQKSSLLGKKHDEDDKTLGEDKPLFWTIHWMDNPHYPLSDHPSKFRKTGKRNTDK